MEGAMEIEQLESFIQTHDDVEIRVITHSNSQFQQEEVEDSWGGRRMLTRRRKTLAFRSLDDVYLELERAGIRRAFLVQQVPEEEMVGRAMHYRDSLASRMPLVF